MNSAPPPERRRRERSVRYPGVPLPEAIDFCRKLDDKGLDGLSAEAIAAGLGYGSIKTNTFSARLSAARQFGLLDLRNDGYALTNLGRGLTRAADAHPSPDLLHRAIASPPLYAELLQRLDGRKLPDPAALANVLRHQFEITAAAQDVAARAFHDSIRFAGLLDPEGHLRPRAEHPAPSTSAPADVPIATPTPRRSIERPAAVRIDLRLWGPDDGKLIRVRAPESITADSFDRLIQALRLHLRIDPT